jgi:hypothetical protein
MEDKVTELLWMEEDELREVCRALMTRLCQTEVMVQVLAGQMNEAVAHGYEQGYTDGFIRFSYEAEAGNVKSLVLH